MKMISILTSPSSKWGKKGEEEDGARDLTQKIVTHMTKIKNKFHH